MSMKIRQPLHKNIQRHIVTLLKGQRVSIEKKFKQIARIADIYWHEPNIVFEIQCSPLSLHEAKKRTADYESLGIHVVWLLHEKRFNKRILPKAEYYLRHKRAFYTNLDGIHKGVIYDQVDKIIYRTRIEKSRPIPIDIFDEKRLLASLEPIAYRPPFSFKAFYERFLKRLYQRL